MSEDAKRYAFVRDTMVSNVEIILARVKLMEQAMPEDVQNKTRTPTKEELDTAVDFAINMLHSDFYMERHKALSALNRAIAHINNEISWKLAERGHRDTEAKIAYMEGVEADLREARDFYKETLDDLLHRP